MKNFSSMTDDDRVIYEYLRALDCPRAVTVALLYFEGEHDQLCELGWSPFDYVDLPSARDSLAATKFLSKADFLETSHDVKKVAMENFFAAEQLCKETNERFLRDRFNLPVTRDILLGMSRKISNVLDVFDAEEFLDSSNWGPGSTTQLTLARATHPKKYFASREITSSAYDFIKDWVHIAYPSWDIGMMCIQNFSKVVTVPKNSKTDRTIAIEPDLNMFFQKGIGKMISRRLKTLARIDLKDQSINSERARLGSKFNHLATVDFSAASDTISREVVAAVIPRDWYSLMETFRSKGCVIEGRTTDFHKFSSMGNGFTFELESLIFWSAAITLCELRGYPLTGISVFGDDVILPCEAVDEFRLICKDLGFNLNSEKSYSSSNFRESCGSYWWNGFSIKPIFFRRKLVDIYERIKLANSIRRASASQMANLGCCARFYRVWKFITDSCGRETPRISEGYGDSGLIVNFDELLKPLKSAFPFEGYFVRAFVSLPSFIQLNHSGLLPFRLRQIGINDRSYGNEVPVPQAFEYTVRRILVRQWQDLGPWL